MSSLFSWAWWPALWVGGRQGLPATACSALWPKVLDSLLLHRLLRTRTANSADMPKRQAWRMFQNHRQTPSLRSPRWRFKDLNLTLALKIIYSMALSKFLTSVGLNFIIGKVGLLILKSECIDNERKEHLIGIWYTAGAIWVSKIPSLSKWLLWGIGSDDMEHMRSIFLKYVDTVCYQLPRR